MHSCNSVVYGTYIATLLSLGRICTVVTLLSMGRICTFVTLLSMERTLQLCCLWNVYAQL